MLFGLVLIISHSQCRFAKREHSYFSEEENHVSYKGWKKTTISCLQYQPVIHWPLLFTFACRPLVSTMGWDAFTVYRSNLPSQPFNIPTVGTFAFYFYIYCTKDYGSC